MQGAGALFWTMAELSTPDGTVASILDCDRSGKTGRLSEVPKNGGMLTGFRAISAKPQKTGECNPI